MLSGAFVYSKTVLNVDNINNPSTTYYIWKILRTSHSNKSVVVQLQNSIHPKYINGDILTKRIQVSDSGHLFIKIDNDICFFYRTEELENMYV